MNTPVSFELAKLLKEKGFNEKVYDCFYTTSDFIKTEKLYPKQIAPMHHYPAPTIAEVVMWLYEKPEHGIWIHSAPENDEQDIIKWAYIIQKTDIAEVRFIRRFSNFNSPTEAYEAAIEYTLNNLI